MSFDYKKEYKEYYPFYYVQYSVKLSHPHKTVCRTFCHRNLHIHTYGNFTQKGCRILSISPGSYLTPMHQSLIDQQPDTAEDQLELIPLERWGHPYEIGTLVASLRFLYGKRVI